jgi:hypothetical protein
MAEFDPDLLLNYCRVLEDGILICDEARADGNPAYGLRVIHVLAERIRAAQEEAEQEAEEARRLH